MAAIGVSALLGTAVTNASLWLAIARGLTLQEAYAPIGFNLTSPTELLSFATILVSGLFGGYVSALHGNGRHVLQGFVGGALGSLFFVAMSLSPSHVPRWYVLSHIGIMLVSSPIGGYIYARRA